MPEALKHTPAVQRVLNGYLSELARHPDSGAVIRPEWDWEEDGEETDTSTLIGLTAKDHEQLLAEPVPLFFDVMLFRDKLLALGPAMPELDMLIGRPQLELREVDKKDNSPAKTIKVSHYEENFNPRLRHGSKMIYSHALKYLIVPQLPREVLDNPENWQLCFNYNYKYQGKEGESGFSPSVSLQRPWLGAFLGAEQTNTNANADDEDAPAKFTLMTLQKDTPPSEIKQWCDYHVREHGVKRMVIYCNQELASAAELPQSTDAYELCYVEWKFSYQCYFTQCQQGALTHCAWHLRQESDYLLNLDLDEYLVNNSPASLPEILGACCPEGRRLTGYDLSADFPAGPDEIDELEAKQQADFSVKIGGMAIKPQDPDTGGKYLCQPSHWHLFTPHEALRKEFFPAPPFWYLLADNRVGFWLARCFYYISLRGFYAWQGQKRRLGLKELPTALDGQKFTCKSDNSDITYSKDLYYLHFLGLGNQWKLGKVKEQQAKN